MYWEGISWCLAPLNFHFGIGLVEESIWGWAPKLASLRLVISGAQTPIPSSTKPNAKVELRWIKASADSFLTHAPCPCNEGWWGEHQMPLYKIKHNTGVTNKKTNVCNYVYIHLWLWYWKKYSLLAKFYSVCFKIVEIYFLYQWLDLVREFYLCLLVVKYITDWELYLQCRL